MARKDVSAIVSGMGVGMSIIQTLDKKIRDKGGADEDVHILATPAGEEYLDRLADMVIGRKQKTANDYLRLLTDEPLIIDAVDGRETIANASDVFAYIDPDFRNWKADEAGPATDKTPSVVYEMTKDGHYAELFGSIHRDIQKLCFTQAQIKSFVKKHREWLLTHGGGTFFLFRSHGAFFVARVHVYSDGLYVHVYRFECSGFWDAVCRHRLVAPQLAL